MGRKSRSHWLEGRFFLLFTDRQENTEKGAFPWDRDGHGLGLTSGDRSTRGSPSIPLTTTTVNESLSEEQDDAKWTAKKLILMIWMSFSAFHFWNFLWLGGNNCSKIFQKFYGCTTHYKLFRYYEVGASPPSTLCPSLPWEKHREKDRRTGLRKWKKERCLFCLFTTKCPIQREIWLQPKNHCQHHHRFPAYIYRRLRLNIVIGLDSH